MSEASERSCSKNWVLGGLKGQQVVLGKMANVCPDLREDFEELIEWTERLRKRVEETTIIEAMPMAIQQAHTNRMINLPKTKTRRIFVR